MINLRVWQDGVYPRYLQIIPAETETAQMHDKNHLGDIVKTHRVRRSISGTIDMVTVPSHPINVGDTFQTPVSVIQITSIDERREARGTYAEPNVEWLRCRFQLTKRL